MHEQREKEHGPLIPDNGAMAQAARLKVTGVRCPQPLAQDAQLAPGEADEEQPDRHQRQR
jgi:hypothetical protein